ncbi:MAG: peptidyl-prolyl cis-trans isomerase [Ignavibacteriales bacterium]|nr:peptidyl-prolyl cis-trans isomerase [Ignavibacteriales bacterium]
MRLPGLLPLSATLLITGFVLLGCQKPQQPRTPVARIDNTTLTLEEVVARFDSARGVSQAQVHEYIQRWLTNELLYQEAVRRGLDKTEELESRMAEIRRQLAINALLDQEVYTLASQEKPEEQVKRYYEDNKSEFIHSHDVALMSFVLFGERDPANAFRTRIARGTPWSQALSELISDPTAVSHVITRADSAYHTERSLLPEELWKVVHATARREPSFPVRTSDGYYVLFVWKLSRRGEIADLPYVTEEIRSRLTIAGRRQVMDQLLENLRSKHVVQILVSSVPQDSISLRPQE